MSFRSLKKQQLLFVQCNQALEQYYANHTSYTLRHQDIYLNKYLMDRPKHGEAEAELLKFQEEFLASKLPPSVTIVKKGDKRKTQENIRDGGF